MTTKERAEKLLELALAQFDELKPAEQEMLKAAAEGRQISFAGKTDQERDPAHADEWGEERIIRASVIRWLCADEQSSGLVDPRGILVDCAKIEGKLGLAFLTVDFPIVLLRCSIPAGIQLLSARTRLLSFDGSHTTSITADGLQADGDISLDRGFIAKGEVRLLGAKIAGSLSCTGGRFENEKGKALSADRAEIGGSVFLREDFIAKGEVRLLGARIAGDLSCTGSRFENENGDALNADRAEIGGDVFLSEGFIAKGEVRLLGAKIAGNLDCAGSRFENENGDALSADRAKIGGSVFLRKGFIAKGEVRLLGAKIAGNLDCTDSRFENENGDALSADRAEIGGSVFLREGFSAKGQVRFLRARIGADFGCSGGTFRNPGGDALCLEGAEVKHALIMREGSSSEGRINLGHCNVGQLADDKDSWPSKDGLVLNGFTYGQFAGPNTPTSAKERLGWLGRQADKPFYPHPYEQLASVLKHMGHNNDAKKVLAAREDARRRVGRMSWWGKRWSFVLKWTIGHGYRPWLAGIWALVVVVAGSVLFCISDSAGVMAQVKQLAPVAQATSQSSQGCANFNAFLYSLDAFLPIVNLHQEQYWQPVPRGIWGTVSWWYLRVHILLGWGLTTLVIAGFTGLVRKE